MKLLLDENLSPKLVVRLADLFPGSQHVFEAGLGSSLDRDVWEYARHGRFAVVTKDEDFEAFSVLLGFPPKLIWVRAGNCTTSDLEALIKSRASDLWDFDSDDDAAIFFL